MPNRIDVTRVVCISMKFFCVLLPLFKRQCSTLVVLGDLLYVLDLSPFFLHILYIVDEIWGGVSIIQDLTESLQFLLYVR